jgi:hypothetical protein
MSHVFISYSRKDSETVDRIVQRLEMVIPGRCSMRNGASMTWIR